MPADITVNSDERIGAAITALQALVSDWMRARTSRADCSVLSSDCRAALRAMLPINLSNMDKAASVRAPSSLMAVGHRTAWQRGL